ncbi:MAG: AAA family ATPase [Lachnospira sp.]
MANKIITISREFGSGGRFIGEEVARKLGIAYYDKELIARVADESGFAKEFIEQKGELSPRKGFFSYAFTGRDASGLSVEDKLYTVQRRVILELAEKGPCVIIGRNADQILRDRDDILNIFISGDETVKIARICKMYGKTENEARKMLRDVDRRRATNYAYYTDEVWGQAKNYALCLNSSKLGFDKCEEIIIGLL